MDYRGSEGLTEGEQSFPSTTWAFRHVRIGLSPGGHRKQAPQALRRFWGLTRRPLRESTPMILAYRGGAVAWIEVRARGRTAFFTGDTLLLDVLREVCQDQ
jgi:hypothetical protein